MRMTDIAGEGILLLGGARAILLQIAQQDVGRGVARHSNFSADPMKRLRNTLTYIYVVVFGTPEEVAQVTARVNTAHLPVHGDGYDAAEPGLQLWVAATLYQSATAIYERIFGQLDAADAESLYRDYAVLGTALQMPQDAWPPDLAAFSRYWGDTSAKWGSTPETLDVCAALLWPTNVPLWLRLGMPLVRLVTAGLLTPQVRAIYALPWSPSRQRRFDATMRLIAYLFPHLPKRIRHWPKNHYLAKFRAQLRNQERR